MNNAKTTGEEKAAGEMDEITLVVMRELARVATVIGMTSRNGGTATKKELYCTVERRLRAEHRGEGTQRYVQRIGSAYQTAIACGILTEKDGQSLTFNVNLDVARKYVM